MSNTTLNRLGNLPPNQLDPAQKELYEVMDAYTSQQYGGIFVVKVDDGSFSGPFGCQLHAPEVGQHFVGFAKAMARIPGLPAKAREVAILVVGRHTQAAYEVYAHQRLAQRRGLTEEEVAMLHDGVCPASLSTEEKAAFHTADQLFQPGPLAEETWAEAVSALGKTGAMAVVQYVAFYKYIATILNGFDVKVPEGM